ncbi:MAG TPA: GNAT family N-acetyltransferase [Candidatus Dormibacteraeota bacterium]|nr:GNAT family N-acetyltransferase [Candidatus Dormibacteraeota bacterium]
MTVEDAAAVAHLATQLGYPSTAAQIERRFHALEESPDARALIAEGRDGTILGWIHVYGTRHLESDPGTEIGGLVVDETARGRGVGSALMASAEAWARERGYEVVRVRTNVIRTEAHEFYKSRGYEVVKSQYRLGKKLV